ncbi:MAG: hypothetical protein MI924_02400 [Chloroflexales bacterium]|nr:hypothetical protein [Chloroflexales bacterium]
MQTLPLRSRALFLRLFGIFLFVAFTTACSEITSTPTPAPNTQTQAQGAKRIGDFSRILGTVYLRAPILERPNRTSGFLTSSSGYSPERIHNFIYLDTQTEQTLQLLPDNNAIILDHTSFPEPIQDQTKERVITWFLYRVVKNDTNQDNRLSEADTQVLAVSDAGGQDYTELIDGVEGIHGHTLRDPETLLVIYRKDGALLLSSIDLPQRALIQTTELPSFGPDVWLGNSQ